MHYVEVKYQPEQSKSYIGSPSIVRLPDGALVASHDYFGALRTLEGENGLTSIYRSEDNGQTWMNVTHIINAYWGTMISLPDALYHIGVTRDYGDMVIRRSTDGGFTWSIPKD
ncbi:MAG: exo-alpha-sialidase, partial [Victivallales bacterium]|nr:exo-alpha-sialidase [Victivallales bacterium]